MKYVVLARRFRPQCFRDLVGQEAIVATLKNALRFNRSAHAYLFSGARGVGKTTLARIFAKALNCLCRGEDLEPCNTCASCQEIIRGQSLDCLEIDGASNRGIDEIRTLNETVAYTPTHGRYKITIIDEVHMLTKEAFNALLKTLEEPPEHAKFFFATTEPHKVLSTITSRCQRFDLQRLTEEEISKSLASIAMQIGREAEPAALQLVASFSEGSLRDAESLLDQLFCFSEGVVTAKDVRALLGLAPEELFTELDQAFSEGRTSFAFELTERLFQEGKQFSHFAEQLINHYRRLAMAKLAGASNTTYTSPQLLYILDYLINHFDSLQKSPWQRIALEAQLLHLLRSKNRVPVEVLVRRLSELEQQNPTADSPPKEAQEKKINSQNNPKEDTQTKQPAQPKIDIPDLPPAPQKLAERPQQIDAPDLSPAPEKPQPTLEIETPPPAPATPSTPGRYETLLQFSAVELEGTLRT